MNVGELIAKLSEHPADLPVELVDDEWGDYYEVAEVSEATYRDRCAHDLRRRYDRRVVVLS